MCISSIMKQLRETVQAVFRLNRAASPCDSLLSSGWDQCIPVARCTVSVEVEMVMHINHKKTGSYVEHR